MSQQRMPFIELDADQSGVPTGYTRYILRNWGIVHRVTIDGISIDEYGEPTLHVAGPEPGVEVAEGEGFTVDFEPSSPDEVSYLYLKPGGVIDPRVFRLRVPPPPKTIPKREWPPEIPPLPQPLDGLYRTALQSYKKTFNASELFIASVAILTEVALDNGASPNQTLLDYIDFIGENGLPAPDGPSARAMEFARKVAADERRADDQFQNACKLFTLCFAVLHFVYVSNRQYTPYLTMEQRR